MNLATVGENGKRKVVHPTEVLGRWNRRKTYVQRVLVTFLLALPWITISGKPMLLLDVFHGKFSILGMPFRAHDLPILLLVALTFILGIALVTALYGRVLYGGACPQSVLIEGGFCQIERWIEGDAYARRRAENAPFSEVITKRVLKWGAFLIVAMTISHSLLAVFVGPDEVRAMIASGPSESPGLFAFMLVSTLVLLFDFGWFREQFCIFVCPYGRIQSIFQDESTVTVAYDVKRGEPRGKPALVSGDCVDCLRCVKVCPTGIDIRNGSSQLECIACTACIDACDDVMSRLGRKQGLIRYAAPQPRSFSRRAWVYLILLLATIGGLAAVVGGREVAMVEVFKVRGDPYVEIADADSAHRFANLFMTEISNQSDSSVEIEFAIKATSNVVLVMPNNPTKLAPGEYLRTPFTLRFEKSILETGRAKTKVTVRITGKEKTEEKVKEVTLVGPF